MNAKQNTSKNDASVWHQLHSEREDICGALLKSSSCDYVTSATDANCRRELLESRLKEVDDAMDRLMSESYGICSKCGAWIEESTLALEPTKQWCSDCSQDVQIEEPIQNNASADGIDLETLPPLSTIYVETCNSTYRIFLLDPQTGSALVQGGRLAEPVDALVNGSVVNESTLKTGWIGIGMRLEMWVNFSVITTSVVKALRVETHAAVELCPA